MDTIRALAALPARFAQTLRRRPLESDLVLAAGLAAIETVTALALVVPVTPGAPTGRVIAVRAVLLAAPLALRRRFPIGVAVVTIAQLPFYWGFGKNNEIGAWIALGVAVYSAAAYGRRPLAAWSCAGLATALGFIVLANDTDAVSTARLVAALVFLAVPFALAWATGSIVRELRRTRSQLQHRTAQLAAEREAGARRAVLEERVRIARELHDVVAHYVSLMSVQAAVARRLFTSRPDQALAAIGEVETAGRQAVSDLQQLVGVLRSDDPDPGPAPQPGLDQLADLVEHTRRAGLAIDVRIEGAPRSLPAGIELSLYRIAQEALTNTLKHAAGASRAEVLLQYGTGTVRLDVTDDGRGSRPGPAPSAGSGTGNGLIGMRERIALHGGRLEVGPTTTGGFGVHAVVDA
jgi:signal transduction histidine kinase